MLTAVSYNLHRRRADGEILGLAPRLDPDILCLQECDARALPDRIGSLRKAAATDHNFLGLAVYIRQERFQVMASASFALPGSVHDRVLDNTRQRLTAALVTERETGVSLVLASIQAAPLVSRNSVRRAQIRNAHSILDDFGAGCPVLMLGDYNYPFLISGLRKQTRWDGYELTGSDARTYSKLLLFRGRFDFASSRGFHVRTVHTLPKGNSDHRAILVQAEVSPALRDTGLMAGSSPIGDAVPETADRFAGHRDVTSWSTWAGRALAYQHRRLSERIGAQGALGVSLGVSGVVAVASAYMGGKIFGAVAGSSVIQALDESVLAAAKGFRSPALDASAVAIARVFGPAGSPVLALVAATALSARAHTRTPLTVLTAAETGSLLMILGSKGIVRRSRPARADAVPPYASSPSFPSGHTQNATTIAGTVAYLLVLQESKRFPQAAIVAGAAGTAAAVGLGRVLLGAHWFTDVLMGWATGSGWLALIITSHRLYLTNQKQPSENRTLSAEPSHGSHSSRRIE